MQGLCLIAFKPIHSEVTGSDSRQYFYSKQTSGGRDITWEVFGFMHGLCSIAFKPIYSEVTGSDFRQYFYSKKLQVAETSPGKFLVGWHGAGEVYCRQSVEQTFEIISCKAIVLYLRSFLYSAHYSKTINQQL